MNHKTALGPAPTEFFRRMRPLLVLWFLYQVSRFITEILVLDSLVLEWPRDRVRMDVRYAERVLGWERDRHLPHFYPLHWHTPSGAVVRQTDYRYLDCLWWTADIIKSSPWRKKS